MALPIDFEEKVRLPAAVGGAGYPYRISASDLMANFRYLDKFPRDPPEGSMMVYGYGGWGLLRPPTAPGLHVLTHDGQYPSWTATSECT